MISLAHELFMSEYYTLTLILEFTKCITPHTNGEPYQVELLTFIFFPSSATILLVLWSANDDGSALTSKASSKVNLPKTIFTDAIVIVSSFRQMEQGVH